MTKNTPVLFPDHITNFLNNPQPEHVMFTRQYKAEDIWDIAPGAILDLSIAWPGLVGLCRKGTTQVYL